MMIDSSQYISYANQTLDWCPMDTLELYKKNLRENPDILKKYGWDKKTVSYSFNNFGFRGNDFRDKPSIMFVGCSHTMGIGINYEDTFGYHVSKEIGLDYINLGQGGLSNDACFRLAYYWIDRINPKILVFLSTHESRFELIDVDEEIRTILPNKDTDLVYKRWYASEFNSFLNKQKNVLAIQTLAALRFIKFCHLEYTDLLRINLDFARDLCHAGVQTNRIFSGKILDLLSK